MESPGFFITGTDTGVGKTFIACALAYVLRGEERIGVMKPVAAGAERTALGRASEDTLLLRRAAGVDDAPETITPELFDPPIAPLAAAERAGRAIDIVRLISCFKALAARFDRMIVEGVGGLLVPLGAGATVADLAAGIGLPVLVVARAGLGTVNHTLLTLEAAKARGLDVRGVVLNGGSPSRGAEEEENARAIEQFSGVAVVARVPRLTLPAGVSEDLVEDILESRMAAAWYRDLVDKSLRRA